MPEEQRDRPELRKVISALQQQDYPADVEVDHLSVRVLASGDCAWKIYPKGGGEYIGGVYNVPVSVSK